MSVLSWSVEEGGKGGFDPAREEDAGEDDEVRSERSIERGGHL